MTIRTHTEALGQVEDSNKQEKAVPGLGLVGLGAWQMIAKGRAVQMKMNL